MGVAQLIEAEKGRDYVIFNCCTLAMQNTWEFPAYPESMVALAMSYGSANGVTEAEARDMLFRRIPEFLAGHSGASRIVESMAAGFPDTEPKVRHTLDCGAPGSFHWDAGDPFDRGDRDE